MSRPRNDSDGQAEEADERKIERADLGDRHKDENQVDGSSEDGVDRATDQLRRGVPDDEGAEEESSELEEGEFESELRRALGDGETSRQASPAESDGEDTDEMNSPAERTDSSGGGASVDPRHGGESDDVSEDAAETAPDPETSEDGFVESGTGELECGECGTTCPPDTQYCVQCGAEIGADAAESERTASDQVRVPSSQSRSLSETVELVTVRDDGSEGPTIQIDESTITFGRNADTSFPTDDFLDPEHASFHLEEGQLYVEDLQTLNGTFIKVDGEAELKPGDIFLAGRQVLKFEPIETDFTADHTSSNGTRHMGSPPPSGDYKLIQIGTGEVPQNVYHLPDTDVVIGRERGDILFNHDQFMSSRHARISSGNAYYLVDLSSSNGTWIRLWDRTRLEDGDHVFMGQQLFRVETGTER